MLIKSIEIKNFKVFQSVEIKDIPRFSVIVGANGTGKSTLFDVFGFLKDALKYNVTSAIEKRGGFHEVVTRGHDNESIEITIRFEVPLFNNQTRIVTYHVSIAQQHDKIFVSHEYIHYRRGSRGTPFRYFEFKDGTGYAITNEEDFDKQVESLDRENLTLDSSDILAIKGLGQFKRFKAANAFRSLIENWHVSDFHITEAQKAQDAGTADHLSASGENLSQFANHLKKHHPQKFNQVIEKMAQRIPGVTMAEPQTTVDGRLVLLFKDGSFRDPFVARWVSDGTIKMFAYLLLLNDPSPHPLLCVEEPENQLYPSLLEQLAEEFRDYCEKPPKAQARGQVFVTTHSPDFLNAVPFESIFWLEKNQGVTVIKRAQDHELLRNLIEAGDQPGYLWKQGLFDNVDPRG